MTRCSQGHENPTTARLCSQCGESVAAPPPLRAPEPPPLPLLPPRAGANVPTPAFRPVAAGEFVRLAQIAGWIALAGVAVACLALALKIERPGIDHEATLGSDLSVLVPTLLIAAVVGWGAISTWTSRGSPTGPAIILGAGIVSISSALHYLQLLGEPLITGPALLGAFLATCALVTAGAVALKALHRGGHLERDARKPISLAALLGTVAGVVAAVSLLLDWLKSSYLAAPHGEILSTSTASPLRDSDGLGLLGYLVLLAMLVVVPFLIFRLADRRVRSAIMAGWLAPLLATALGNVTMALTNQQLGLDFDELGVGLELASGAILYMVGVGGLVAAALLTATGSPADRTPA